MSDQDTTNIAAFVGEAGHLKMIRRSGWWIAGVRDPESVAEHSYRVGIIAYVLAVMEGCDPNRAATLGLFHDLPETRIGDVPSVGRPHVNTAPAEDVIKAQTADLPGSIADAVRGLIGEHEAQETPESACSRDADKIECLITAREYQARGYDLAQPWVDTMLEAVRTESGKRLARAAATAPVDGWWHDIVASYGRR